MIAGVLAVSDEVGEQVLWRAIGEMYGVEQRKGQHRRIRTFWFEVGVKLEYNGGRDLV